MIRAWSVPDVRAIEAAAMAGLAEGELMQRAARGLADVATVRLREVDGRNVVGLVGGGDNGGDTLFALALLSDAGFACAAVLLAGSGREGTHAAGLAAAEQSGVATVLGAGSDDVDAAHLIIGEADLVLDGVVGIGGSPGLRESSRLAVEAIPASAYVIAVDLASGLDPEGLSRADESVFADETVTFGVPKPCHLLPPGEAATGVLTVVDIGLDPTGFVPSVVRLEWDDVASLWPVPGPNDDKYRRGVLGVVAGGEAYPGAAVLTVTAAVETGVGMVRYVGTPTSVGLVRNAVPEAVVGEGRVQAWVVGPGLDAEATDGASRAQVAVARRALDSELPVLIDAGGLDLVGSHAEDAPDWDLGFGTHRAAPTLLTPHAGECARLLSRLGGIDISREAVEREPVTYARKLAELTGATVLLKGATTVVVSSDSAIPAYAQSDAPPWIATAGAGDVLAGVIGTLLAAGLTVRDAAALGALAHGVAGDVASAGGPVRALRVAESVPAAVRRLLTRT